MCLSLERVRFCCCGVTGDDGWVHGEDRRRRNGRSALFLIRGSCSFLRATAKRCSQNKFLFFLLLLLPSHFSHGVKEEEKKKTTNPKGD